MKRIVAAVLLCTSVVSAQDAGSASDSFYAAIRANDLAKIESLLKGGANVNVADPRGGATPLMNAAAIGSVEAMRLLLDRGADPNAAGASGATALIWGAGDLEKVRLLLARKANPNAATQRGRTALHIAARMEPSAETVKALIAAGADAKAVDALKVTVLHQATLGNDTETIRLLVDAGAAIDAVDAGGFTPLMGAASSQNVEAVKLLLAKGANVNARSSDGSFQKVKNGTIALGLWTPLSLAAAFGSVDIVRTLLDAGANVNTPDIRGMTPLMLAVATDRQNLDVIRMLIAKGADVNVKSSDAETALDWARKIGSPRVIETLERAGAVGAKREPPVLPAAAHADVKTAVQRSLSLLNRMTTVAAANGGCASCHSHNIVDVAQKAARAKGFTFDEKLLAQRQTLTKAPFFSPANLFERYDPPGSPDVPGYALVALASSGYAPDRTSDAVVAHLMSLQRRDGRWTIGAIARPPIEDGDIFRTAIAIRALTAYEIPGRAPEIKARVAKAREWLAAAKPTTAEDRNMQLLGLHWAGAPMAQRARLASAIIAKQRTDGGWAQTDHLSSDAYATGQSLFALSEAGGIAAGNAAYKKGTEFLLSTQRPDGSWYVRSRAPKFQPYFDGGFPYEHDQWISSMATGWATAALTVALPSQ